MDFTKFKNVYDFYEKMHFSKAEAFDYLLVEFKKLLKKNMQIKNFIKMKKEKNNKWSGWNGKRNF